MTKQEALSLTADSPSSIFTREDVQRMINAIDIPESAEAPIARLTADDISDLAEDLTDYITRNDNILDRDAVELSIDYNRTVQIDSCPIDESELKESLVDALMRHMTERGLYQEDK